VQSVENTTDLADHNAPVVGTEESFLSTTGEVNLYCDPRTFGTVSPQLYIDCEGLGGGEPAAAAHQKKWQDSSRSHPIHQKQKQDIPIDRKWAVENLYPKFIYLFSDVVCYVTRNPRGWAEIVDNLLTWASVAAQHAVNQYALPAAIIVLNGPPTSEEMWIAGDHDAMTNEFFKAVEEQITKSAFVRSLAAQVGS
jgi:hypothetical protein